jgi:hypothetical protein
MYIMYYSSYSFSNRNTISELLVPQHIVNGACGATIIPKIMTRPPCRSTQPTCWVIIPPAATELSRVGNAVFVGEGAGGGGAGGELPACQTRREVTGTMV